MSAFLDPWADAKALALRLRQPGARLVLILAAEAWCEKCRQFRSIVETRAAQSATNETWLWLDLEEHAEFLNDYLPEDLPQLLVYQDGQIVRRQTVEPDGTDLEATLRPHILPENLKDPGIYPRLISNDWAV